MMDEVNSISSVSEETSAADEEVFASVEEQYVLMENVIQSFHDWEKWIAQLSDLTSLEEDQ